MKAPLIVSNSIKINATPEKVWEVLVNSDYTKQYMFGCEIVSDWVVGQSLVWRGKNEGNDIDYVTGFLVKLEPHSEFAFTTFDPFSKMEDIAENHTTVSYTLKEINGQTELSVSQGDFAHVAEGERRYNEVNNNGDGWNPILIQIKEIAERI